MSALAQGLDEGSNSCLTYTSMLNQCKQNDSSLLCVPWQNRHICHRQAFSLALPHQQRPVGTKRGSSGHYSSRTVEDKCLREKKTDLCVAKAAVLIILKLGNNWKTPGTWLMLGWAFVFFFEVVSRPQREENLLLRLLQERDMACVRRLTPVSVRAATCKNTRTQSGLKHAKWAGDNNLFDLT